MSLFELTQSILVSIGKKFMNGQENRKHKVQNGNQVVTEHMWFTPTSPATCTELGKTLILKSTANPHFSFSELNGTSP